MVIDPSYVTYSNVSGNNSKIFKFDICTELPVKQQNTTLSIRKVGDDGSKGNGLCRSLLRTVDRGAKGRVGGGVEITRDMGRKERKASRVFHHLHNVKSSSILSQPIEKYRYRYGIKSTDTLFHTNKFRLYK